MVSPATDCGNFTQIGTAGPRNNTGNVTYVDPTVAFGASYRYQVRAFNSNPTPSAYATMTSPVAVPALPPAPTSLIVSAVPAGGKSTATLTWVAATDPASFTIQRANNASFTSGLNSSTVAGTLRTTNQTVNRSTVYYYRIRANNSIGGSSAWTNAVPFPIRTP